MLKNVTGEVSITWGDKTVTKTLSGALTQLALVMLAAVVFTSIIAFVILGISLISFIALLVVSAGGIGAAVYFGKDYLTGMLLKGAQSAQTTVVSEPAPSSDTTQSNTEQAEASEVKA